MKPSQLSKPRIEVVDALRGFALMGILLLHSIEHFDFFWASELNPKIFHSIDPHVSRMMFFLFGGKAYSIFSLMFGFSFFIQMDRAAQKGIDFRQKFLWRLVLLFIIGYIFSIIYDGQILTMYAIMGLPLILFYNVNRKILAAISVLLVLQIPTIINIVQTYIDPAFEYVEDYGGLWGEAFNTYANGSFLDVAKHNAWKGHKAVWLWSYFNGRYLQLFGLFLAGLIIGKAHFFDKYTKYKKQTLVVFLIALGLFVALHLLFVTLPKFELPEVRQRLMRRLVKSYADLSLTTVWITSILMLYQYLKMKKPLSRLAFYGRMSLTSYLMQPLIGVPFFYGYGFAMYRFFGPTLSFFYGIVFFAFQLWFCKFWLKRFHYGPLEWIWRALTFLDFKLRFKKTKEDQ